MQSHYYELTLKPSAHLELFIDFINTVFPDSLEELDDAIILRSQEDDFIDLAWACENFASELSTHLGQEVTVDTNIEQKANEDWVKIYQESIQPVEVGSFYVHPSWNESKADKKNIIVDPALAFGSGHHPTTASCLAAIEAYVTEGMEVLDVGSGSGVLSIAAAYMGAKVDACDTDIVSVEETQKNALQNRVTLQNVWEGSVGNATSTYDVVIANIVADVLGFIASDIFKHLDVGGIAILSGILDKYEHNVLTSYKNFKLIKRQPHDEWVTLIVQKETDEPTK